MRRLMHSVTDSLLDAELQKLRQVIRDSLPSIPPIKKEMVGIGSTVKLENGKTYFIAGDWTLRAGQSREGAVVMSAQAPLAIILRGKKVGDKVILGRDASCIRAILYL